MTVETTVIARDVPWYVRLNERNANSWSELGAAVVGLLVVIGCVVYATYALCVANSLEQRIAAAWAAIAGVGMITVVTFGAALFVELNTRYRRKFPHL